VLKCVCSAEVCVCCVLYDAARAVAAGVVDRLLLLLLFVVVVLPLSLRLLLLDAAYVTIACAVFCVHPQCVCACVRVSNVLLLSSSSWWLLLLWLLQLQLLLLTQLMMLEIVWV